VPDCHFPWLERQASLWPGRVAVVDPDGARQYTYSELLDRSRAVQAHLAQHGVGPGDRVASLMQNGIRHLDLLFACGRLGAIYAPLNWRLSQREVAALLDDLAPWVVVSDDEFAHLVATSDARIRRLPSESLPTSTHTALAAPTAIHMATPWLILYTGGTTGVPKGAVLTHGSILWNCINTAISWGLSEGDVGPSFTPMFHTGGFNVFTLPLLLLGGRVVLPSRFKPAAALDILEQERPTVLFMVPTMFQLTAEEPRFKQADLSSLRWAISGGAPLPEPVYRVWSHKVPVFKQGYGLTEVGPNNFATPDVDAVRKAGSVGRLTYFAQARIVDDQGQDVADDVPGELLLTGPHMCDGYWRRPEETADAVRDGWFRTGDIARRDSEGYYYIVDRKKDMIITGGENVYPNEVEAVLYNHPAIRQVAVVGVPDPLWGEAVTALVSLQRGASVTSEELRIHTRAGLARYKVPKRFIVVDELPTSAAGKILRTASRHLAEHA